jgi:hypothetical protein
LNNHNKIFTFFLFREEKLRLDKDFEKDMDTLKKKNEEVLSSLEKKYQNEKLNKEKQILAEISKLAKSSDLKKDNEIVANDREINVKNQITEFFS